MNRKTRGGIACLAIAAASSLNWAYAEESTAERVHAKADHGARKAVDAVGHAAKKTGEALEKAAHKTGEAVDRAAHKAGVARGSDGPAKPTPQAGPHAAAGS